MTMIFPGLKKVFVFFQVSMILPEAGSPVKLVIISEVAL